MVETPLLYRFTVKCDRDTNREIEKLAKACNVSAQTYVQKHFETITGAAMEIAPVIKAPTVAPDRPERHRKPRREDRIMAALQAAKRPDGLSPLSLSRLAQITTLSVPTVQKYIDGLIVDGALEIVSDARKRMPTVYRVLKKPAQAQ